LIDLETALRIRHIGDKCIADAQNTGKKDRANFAAGR
jgi:hypothetical protein